MPRTKKAGRIKLSGKMRVINVAHGGMGGQAMTIDDALDVILEAKKRMGGNRCLILSLTGSGYADTNVNSMVIQQEGESGYVEVRANHPEIQEG